MSSTDTPQSEFSRLRIDCPHCGSHMKVRTSKSDMSLLRELYLHCTNEFDCGFRGKANLEFVHTLTVSRCPNPDVYLLTSPWVLKQMKLDLPTVNDECYDEETPNE
ncbi:ogr/Delta-like zinc finger family protein [Halomonas sp. GD1P12]|uniref:ogr/Delta-like zinc finger family protein n=1 Tax=Halomonas sp. GD1P12 TaxID=2982691 RepID=UPI0021E40EBC|nr:ogr/Delta-like zinc finger family protein [Halomonas sp. GD1P12]UYF99361.1 ogr/Delta-like zinc finger family protein [Halomonas sp. GD1P12]